MNQTGIDIRLHYYDALLFALLGSSLDSLGYLVAGGIMGLIAIGAWLFATYRILIKYYDFGLTIKRKSD